MQLVRRYNGRTASEFVKVAVAYAKSAAERMDLWKELDDGRRVGVVLRTFEQAKKWEHYHPRPKSPPKRPPGGGGKAAKTVKCEDKPSLKRFR